MAPLAITSPSGSVTEALGTRYVVNVVVCESNEPAQGCRTDRVLCFRKVEEPLVMSDGVAERLGAVVVKVRCSVLDAPECRDL